jgi:hypothetical protein
MKVNQRVFFNAPQLMWLVFVSLLFNIAAAQITAAPVPTLPPTAYVDGNSIVIELRWDYPKNCQPGRGNGYIQPEEPTTSANELKWSLNYGFFGSSFRGECDTVASFIGGQKYRWTNLAPGQYRVTVNYVDTSSGSDCGLTPAGCPIPVQTRAFTFDLAVQAEAVPTVHTWLIALMMLLITYIGRRFITRQS